MKKMGFVLFLITAGALAGYFYSQEIYSFYVKMYYTKIDKNAYSADLQKLGILYYSGVPSTEEFEKLFIKLHSYNSSEIKLNCIGTLYYSVYKKDFISSLDYFNKCRSKKIDDFPILRKIIPLFYEAGYFGDVASILKDYNIKNEKDMLFFGAMSFYKTEKYSEALSYFRILDKSGVKNPEIYDMAGKIMEHDSKGDKKKLALAVQYYEKAYELARSRSEYRDNLLRIYLKLGMKDKAKNIAGLK